MRNFYRDPATGEVWEYSDEQVAEGIVGEGFIAMTQEEIDAWVNPPPTEEQLLASASARLQAANQLASAQKVALTNRIGVINDAIEFEEATPAELVELPIRQAQLTAWKRYAVLLGRVTTQTGWYATVDWPVEPVDGMDLTVSAVAPQSPQLQ